MVLLRLHVLLISGMETEEELFSDGHPHLRFIMLAYFLEINGVTALRSVKIIWILQQVLLLQAVSQCVQLFH